MSAEGGSFELPEIFSFPPFFTLQIVDETKHKQLEQWKDLIVNYHKAHRKAILVVSEFELWQNAAIGCKLSEEGIAAVMDFLVASKYGEWEEAGSRARCRVYWKSLDEWAGMIYDFARESDMIGNVFTVHEIHSGEISEGQPFHGLEAVTVVKALEKLEEQGKATLFTGSSPDAMGVKFLAA